MPGYNVIISTAFVIEIFMPSNASLSIGNYIIVINNSVVIIIGA